MSGAGVILGEAVKAGVYGVLDAATLFHGIRRTIGGETIRFPARWSRYYEADYEVPTFEFLRRACRPGDTVLDIGAHIGLFSVVTARRVGPSGRVFSFEPTLGSRQALQRVIALNGVQHLVEVRAEAVSERSGVGLFHSLRIAGSNANSLVRSDRHEGVTFVPVVSIDDFLADRVGGQCQVLKIDVEGAELSVLRGAQGTLRTARPSLWLALHPAALAAAGANLGEIWDLLSTHRMRLERERAPLAREWFCGQVDLFDVEVRPVEDSS